MTTHRILTMKDFELWIPSKNRPKLREIVSEPHLEDIAETLEEWEDMAPLLDLLDEDIAEIKELQLPEQRSIN